MSLTHGSVPIAENLKQGYLYIKRERSATLFKPWHQSYFVLRANPFMLEEYKEASLKSLRQVVMINPIKHVGRVFTSKSKQYAFEVLMMDCKPLMLACENELLLEEWMRVFKDLQPGVDSPRLSSTPVSHYGSDYDGQRPPSISMHSSFRYDHRHRSLTEADPIRSSESLPRLCRSVGDQHSLLKDSSFPSVSVENILGTGSMRRPKMDRFEVHVLPTQLSKANLLEGPFIMAIANSRISLLSIIDMEERLSWPLSQVKHFTSQMHNLRFLMETGKTCHFGHGKLAFETTRADLIAECIRSQSPQEKRDMTHRSRPLWKVSNSTSEDDETSSDRCSHKGSQSDCPKQHPGQPAIIREDSDPVDTCQDTRLQNDDTVFVPVAERHSGANRKSSELSLDCTTTDAEEGEDMVLEKRMSQHSTDKHGSSNDTSEYSTRFPSFDDSNVYEYAEINDDSVSYDFASVEGLDSPNADIEADNTSQPGEDYVLPNIPDKLNVNERRHNMQLDVTYSSSENLDVEKEPTHAYLQLMDEDLDFTDENNSAELLSAIEKELSNPAQNDSPLTSPKGSLRRYMRKSKSEGAVDPPRRLQEENRRASEPKPNDVRTVHSRLGKITENEPVDGYLEAKDINSIKSSLNGSGDVICGENSPKHSRKISPASTQVISFPKAKSISKRTHSSCPFDNATAPFTNSHRQSSVASKEGKEALIRKLRMKRNQTEPIFSSHNLVTPELDRNTKPKHPVSPSDSNADGRKRHHLTKAASFEISSEPSSDDGGAEIKPPPRLPRAPTVSDTSPKKYPTLADSRRRSTIRQKSNQKKLEIVDRVQQNQAMLSEEMRKQRSFSNPTSPVIDTTPPTPKEPLSPAPDDSDSFSGLAPPLPPKAKLLAATKSAPSHSNLEGSSQFVDELRRSAFSANDVQEGDMGTMCESSSEDTCHSSSKDIIMSEADNMSQLSPTSSSASHDSGMVNQLTASMEDLVHQMAVENSVNEKKVVDNETYGRPTSPPRPLREDMAHIHRRSTGSPPLLSPWSTSASTASMMQLPDVVLRRSTLNDIEVPVSHAGDERRATLPVLPKMFTKTLKEEFPTSKKFF